MAFMSGGALSCDAADFFDRTPNSAIEKPFKALRPAHPGERHNRARRMSLWPLNAASCSH